MATLPKRVLLLGWDAADWNFLTPLLDDGKMPNLQKLIDSGTSGKIATLQPALSPILWNSIATGKRGDKHGVLSFVEPRADGQGIRSVSSYSRRSKALWNLLSQQGKRSVVVNWYASHPAESVAGAVVSNQFTESVHGSREIAPTAFHPQDLAEVMQQLRITPETLCPAQMAPFFLEKLPEDNDPRLQALAGEVAKCASIHNAATYLAETEDWDFLAVYYDMIDHAGHGFAEFCPPKMDHVSDEDYRTFRHVMESTYRYHDLMLGKWLEIAGDDTAVIVLSDHGFYLNEGRPMAERGHLTGEQPTGVSNDPLIWHRPHGFFCAAGPGIKADALVHGATLLDVAPTILTLLGMAVPEDFEGSTMTAIFGEGITSAFCPSMETPHPDDGMHRDTPADESDPWAARQALEQLVELGYIDALEGSAEESIASAIDSRDSSLAQIYYSIDRFQEALELFTALAERNPSSIHHRARQAMCLGALKRTAEAKEIVTSILAEAPSFGFAHIIAGQLASAGGDDDEAERIYQRLNAAEGEMPALHTQLGAIYLRREKWSEAETAYRRALAADPDRADAHDGLAVALRRQGHFDEAIYEHMTAVTLQHDRAQSHVNLGITLAVTRRLEWAIRAFTVATDLAPDEPYPHRCLAQLYRRHRLDRMKAIHHVLRARELQRGLRGKIPAFRHGA